MAENLAEPELAALEQYLDEWWADQVESNPAVDSVERIADEPRWWFVRILGEDKEVWTIRFHLRPRTLYYETYLAPAPRFNAERVYAYLLRKHIDRYGVTAAIGAEDGCFLVGHLPNDRVRVEGELDRVVGSLYQATEELFRPIIAMGFTPDS